MRGNNTDCVWSHCRNVWSEQLMTAFLRGIYRVITKG